MADLKGLLSGVGTLLTGTAMGMQGRGAEFAQGLEQNRLRDEERRKKAQQEIEQGLAIGARVGINALKAGDKQAAEQFLAKTVTGLKEQYPDYDLNDILTVGTMMRNGEHDKALQTLELFDQQNQLRGLVPEMKAPEPVEDKVLLETRKEARSELRKAATGINEEVSVINTNYGKLEGLARQVKKGSRAAVSQMLISLVKLGDPTSVVKETEMEAALNAENPLAALVSKGVSGDVAEAVLKRIDPLNPDTINVDDVLATGRALIAANAPDIMERYSGIKQRGRDFLSEVGYKSIFAGALEDRVSGLNKFMPVVPNHRQYGDITEDDIQATMRGNNMTRKQVLEGLGIK